MDVNLIIAIERDFQIIEGNTFDPYLDFFQDDKDTISYNLTGSSIIMTIRRKDGQHCFGNTQNEILAIGTGITIENDDKGNTNNRAQFLKIFQSQPGHYKYDMTWTDPAGKVKTIVRGQLVIEAKA